MILIDEIDALTRTRASSDTGSTSAIKSIFSACWAALEQHHHQVVVVGTSSIPDQIDDGFLRRLTTKIWVRGPEGPERFAIAKSKLARVYHDIDLEPTPLTSHGTTSLYGFLTKVDKNNAIAKLTGAEIAHAIREAVCMAEMDLDDTEVWTKVSRVTSIMPRVSNIASDALLLCITSVYYLHLFLLCIASMHYLYPAEEYYSGIMLTIGYLPGYGQRRGAASTKDIRYHE